MTLAYELYGYTADEIPGMTVLDIRPQSERDRMLSAIRDRSDLERPERWQHLRANGEIIDVLLRAPGGVRWQEAILAIVQDRTELAEANRQASHAQTFAG
ncbi:PAS domain-containing protein [Brucella abortus]|nr:PAS domain-containing protein [Brucella abortus]